MRSRREVLGLHRNTFLLPFRQPLPSSLESVLLLCQQSSSVVVVVGGRDFWIGYVRKRDMAVQAQHPSGFAFSPDFRNRGGSFVIEDFQMLQDQGNTVGLYGGHLGGINNATVFSDPQSELTCNASGKRKRPLEEPPMVMPQPIPDYDSNLASVLSPICYPDITASAAGCQQSRLLESAGTSTSGRTASPLTMNLVSQIFHHGVEIDSLIRLQNERLQSGVEEARKKYFKALLWGMEQRAAKRLREKEAELEKARRKNAELEERVRQLATEGEMWFAVARNNEIIAASLRADLEQILLRNAAAAQVKEGYGDTDDDAQSCRSVEATGRKSIAPAPAPTDEVRRWPRAACKSCAEGDVCVLLLPCKHLCLCKSCESKTHACPCCGTVKNACLQIFMP